MLWNIKSWLDFIVGVQGDSIQEVSIVPANNINNRQLTLHMPQTSFVNKLNTLIDKSVYPRRSAWLTSVPLSRRGLEGARQCARNPHVAPPSESAYALR